MWIVHLLIAGTLLLVHYLLQSISIIPSILVGVVGLYFFFRGLNGARDRFAPPVPVTDLSVVHAPHAVSGDVWSGDLAQLPDSDAQPAQPTIEYSGVVPLSIQPGDDPRLEQPSFQEADVFCRRQGPVLLDPEEPQPQEDSQKGGRP